MAVMALRLRVGAQCIGGLLALSYLFVVCLWTQVTLLDDSSPQLFAPLAVRGDQVSITIENNSTHVIDDSQSRRKTSLRFVKLFDGNNNNMTRRNVSLPPPRERAPAFIIIGCQKGGTRALNLYLSQHSLIEFPTAYAEPHFFDLYWPDEKTPAENLHTYIDTYYERDCRYSPCLAGESTPVYLYDTPIIPSRLQQTCPWVKLIVLLRDPVKRAHSQHNMLLKEGVLDVPFEQHLEHDLQWIRMVGLDNTTQSRQEEDAAWNKYMGHPEWENLMLGRGFYEIQLRLWFQHSDRNQFLILKSNDLDVHREATMKRVCAFLRIPYQSLDIQEKVHVRNYSTPLSPKVETWLYEFYRPYNERLEGLLGPEWKGVFQQEH